MDQAELDELVTAAAAAAAAATAEWYSGRRQPGGVRTKFVHHERGRQFVDELLSDSRRLKDYTRLSKLVFDQLLHWLKTKATPPLQKGRLLSVEEKLVIFMNISAFGTRWRPVAEHF